MSIKSSQELYIFLATTLLSSHFTIIILIIYYAKQRERQNCVQFKLTPKWNKVLILGKISACVNTFHCQVCGIYTHSRFSSPYSHTHHDNISSPKSIIINISTTFNTTRTNQPTNPFYQAMLSFSLSDLFSKFYFTFLPPTNFCTHLPTYLTSKYSTSTSDSYILTRQTKPNLLNTQTLFFYFSHLSYFLYLTSISTPYHHHMWWYSQYFNLKEIHTQNIHPLTPQPIL